MAKSRQVAFSRPKELRHSLVASLNSKNFAPTHFFFQQNIEGGQQKYRGPKIKRPQVVWPKQFWNPSFWPEKDITGGKACCVSPPGNQRGHRRPGGSDHCLELLARAGGRQVLPRPEAFFVGRFCRRRRRYSIFLEYDCTKLLAICRHWVRSMTNGKKQLAKRWFSSLPGRWRRCVRGLKERSRIPTF